MGLFSRVRRLHAVPAPEPDADAHFEPAVPEPDPGREPDPPVSTRRAVVASAPSSLRDGLQQLYAMRPSRDAYAEEAVKLIVKGMAVKAAAILVYEQRQGRLKLAASVGLESEAAQVLNGEAGIGAWDIPLRSLRNRRINVIESAHENPFVPKPLVGISPRRLTIASVPFFHANAPVGVVVLFSPTPRGFADGLLKSLSQALRVCALALAELPVSAAAKARAKEEEAPAAQPNLLRGLAALKAELARLTDALDEAERQRATEAAERVTAQSFLKAAQERAAQLERELAELREAQSRLPDAEEQVRNVTERLAAAVEAADAARTRVGELQTAVAQHERRAAADAAAIEELTALRKDLEQQLQSALDTARQRGEEAVGLHAQVAELTPRAAEAADLQRALAATDAAKAETEAGAARLRQELLAAQDQRAKLEAALEQAHASLSTTAAEHQHVATQLAEAQARAAALDRAQQDLARAEQELDGLRTQLQTTEAERTARQQELETARAALSAEGRELAAAAERAADRVAELEAERQRLTGELDAARVQAEQVGGELRVREEALARAEAAHARLSARVSGLETEVGGTRTASRDLESQVAEQQRLNAQLAAERRDLQERINALAAGGQTVEQERQAAVDTAQRRVRELLAEIDRLSAALDATRGAAAEDLTRTRHDAESTLDALRVELAETLRARDELQRALAQSQTECVAHQHALAEMSAERTRLETAAERLRTERAELGARIDDAGAKHTGLVRAHEEAAARIAALENELHTVRDRQLADTAARLVAEQEARETAEAALASADARHQDERAELHDRLAELARERERLAKALEEKDLLLQSAEEGLTALDLAAEPDEDEEFLAIDRDHAPAGVERDAADVLAEVEEIASGEMILLDDDAAAAAAARQLADFGHRVTALPPTVEGGRQLKDHTVACAAINLAVPTAWSMVRHLRNGSGVARMPLVAYALPPNAPKGFWVGPVDFALLPVEETPLAEMLNRMVPKVRRVIAMSNDIDVMSDVRTQLTAVGISTAVVLDGRQALDLVPTIRPEAAILHLSPSCVDVFRAIAGLRSAEASRDIPILFLLDAEAQAREEAFLTAGMRMLTGRGSLAPDQLVDSLASAFDPFRGV